MLGAAKDNELNKKRLDKRRPGERFQSPPGPSACGCGAIRPCFMPASPNAVQHLGAGALWTQRYGGSTAASAAVRRISVVDVIEDKRTARNRVRPRASNDRIVRPINVISGAARERRGMRLANASIASVVLEASHPLQKIK